LRCLLVMSCAIGCPGGGPPIIFCLHVMAIIPIRRDALGRAY